MDFEDVQQPDQLQRLQNELRRINKFHRAALLLCRSLRAHQRTYAAGVEAVHFAEVDHNLRRGVVQHAFDNFPEFVDGGAEAEGSATLDDVNLRMLPDVDIQNALRGLSLRHPKSTKAA